ncbi:MAG: MgpA protein [Candidatus Moranbacteria bacterium GW2011_GWE1_35_17]|nr:MAG: MgpA protein [Candidatus Moranbacteria bacterium GW2011_GWE1_35_17]KKP72493.1 MAG: MgpA protein [Candidatus Moranbacteria bacterium GW2011_GWE2_35_164]KKP84231.1 MAG: MgpA protein [Candidatus Moranbacteria bacterium GW2011_GWF2_35_54]KKP84468.1 MAG: MgpA protein [Candidatus Moranbacteria bacterium GW2011_GWF1_35_5]
MALKINDQIKETILSAKKILILLPQNPNNDAIGSGLAFYLFLKEKSVDSDIATSDPLGNIKKLNFLPQPQDIRDSVLGARDFILSFNTKYNKITSIKTEELAEETRIHITPENGTIDPRDFSFIPAEFKYNLLICLNSPDKESFGKIFEENPDIFYEVPIINIDNHSTNDNFGQINLIDIKASSVSEILFDLFHEIDPSLIKNDIAKCILTGIISATKSFQNTKTTPHALKISSDLMVSGANQQEIIRHLFKTQPFNILKLWGRIMSKLKWDEELKLSWSVVSIEDFVQSRTEPSDISFILDKIQANYEAGEIFLILYAVSSERVKGVLKFSNPEKMPVIPPFENGLLIGDTLEFDLDSKSISDAETYCLEKLKQLLIK